MDRNWYHGVVYYGVWERLALGTGEKGRRYSDVRCCLTEGGVNSDIEGTECAFACPGARRLADHGEVSYHHCTGLRTNVDGYLLWNGVMGG